MSSDGMSTMSLSVAADLFLYASLLGLPFRILQMSASQSNPNFCCCSDPNTLQMSKLFDVDRSLQKDKEEEEEEEENATTPTQEKKDF
jgi:WD40 repeat protein